MSKLEAQLEGQFKALKLAGYEREHRFAAIHVGLGKGIRERLTQAGLKDWRFDFCWPELMFAVEVEGGGWSGGRHTRGKGFADDLSSAFCCSSCHDVIDRRVFNSHFEEEIEFYLWRANKRTWRRLFELGILSIKGVK